MQRKSCGQVSFRQGLQSWACGQWRTGGPWAGRHRVCGAEDGDVGTPMAAATCIRPESLETKTRHREMRARPPEGGPPREVDKPCLRGRLDRLGAFPVPGASKDQDPRPEFRRQAIGHSGETIRKPALGRP
jgi:hypothetical protein